MKHLTKLRGKRLMPPKADHLTIFIQERDRVSDICFCSHNTQTLSPLCNEEQAIQFLFAAYCSRIAAKNATHGLIINNIIS